VATKTENTTTYSCDLCKAQVPRDQLHRFGLVEVTDIIYHSNPPITGSSRDVCQSCQQRPIAELITLLNTPTDEEKSLDTHLTPASTPPLPSNWPGLPARP
jgi:hypothetical protein